MWDDELREIACDFILRLTELGWRVEELRFYDLTPDDRAWIAERLRADGVARGRAFFDRAQDTVRALATWAVKVTEQAS